MQTRNFVALLSFLAFFLGALCAVGTGGCSSSSSAPTSSGTCPSLQPSTGGTCNLSAQQACEYGDPCSGTGKVCQCDDGAWSCIANSAGSCDASVGPDATSDANGDAGRRPDASDAGREAGTCPSPSAVLTGVACTDPGLSCLGTIDDNCGTPIGSNFQCMCSIGGHWQCEGPDASGVSCDAGQD